MFYSHNLLARKGPLGTVWCAAHLQNKLRKSNYITINIPSTVEQIMNPQVPIALRMSGHLLLGVVRIYSKKVEYLQHDYKVLQIDISKAYAYADINLPEDANQAKFESITIPDNFALDLLDVDEYNPDGSPDIHLRQHEEISLLDHSPVSLSKNRDQVPAGYIMISLGEDDSTNQSPSLSRSMLMEEDSQLITSPAIVGGVQDLNPNQQLGSSDIVIEDSERPFETMRDRIISPASSPLPDRVEPDHFLVEQLSNEKTNGSQDKMEVSVENLLPSKSAENLLPSKQTLPVDSAHSEPSVDHLDPHLLYGVAPSPLAEPALAAEQPRAKRRRIKYDDDTVLTNEFMKKSLDDPSNLKRKRKGVCSLLDVWKLNNTRKKEKVLFDPITTGFCDNLLQISEDAYMSTKARLVDIEQAHFDDPEHEHLRGILRPAEDNVMSSPDHTSFFYGGMNEDTPVISTGVGSKSYQLQTTIETGVGSPPDPMSSVGYVFSDIETPMTFSQSHQGFENSGALSNIPEGSNADEELAFMENDEGTPTRSRGTPDVDYSPGKQRSPPEIGSLLPRTRAVAQYIKEKSSASPFTPQGVGSVSLNSILDGKKRKICTRMFFETLVLKSCDLVDVKQNEPYGDITLNVTSKLSKLQFSNQTSYKAAD